MKDLIINEAENERYQLIQFVVDALLSFLIKILSQSPPTSPSCCSVESLNNELSNQDGNDLIDWSEEPYSYHDNKCHIIEDEDRNLRDSESNITIIDLTESYDNAPGSCQDSSAIHHKVIDVSKVIKNNAKKSKDKKKIKLTAVGISSFLIKTE